MQLSSLRFQRSLSRGPHYLDNAIRTSWLLNLHSLASQLTLTVNSSFFLSISLSFAFCLSPITHVSGNHSWPGLHRSFSRNYSIERPTIHCWTCRHLSFLATLFMVRPVYLRPFVHDTTFLWSFTYGSFELDSPYSEQKWNYVSNELSVRLYSPTNPLFVIQTNTFK